MTTSQALYTNNASTTLNANINAAVTSIVLAGGTGALFPSPTGSDYFYCTLSDAASGAVVEIVKCTSRSTDTLTVTRAQQGTSASAFLAGDRVELRPTAYGFSELGALGAANTWAETQTFNKLIDASGASAGQIKFPSTQNASADANTLDDYSEGTFTGTLTGCTTSPTTTFRYTKVGNVVTLRADGDLSATSNSTSKTITGMPAAIRPARTTQFLAVAIDNGGSPVVTFATLSAAGVITYQPSISTSSWTAAGTATLYSIVLSYTVA